MPRGVLPGVENAGYTSQTAFRQQLIKNIIPGTSGKRVVTFPSKERVITSIADQNVITAITAKDVRQSSANKRIGVRSYIAAHVKMGICLGGAINIKIGRTYYR